MASNAFEYTGNDQKVPNDVVSVRFHPNVVKVDHNAFYNCNNLRQVVLNEGLYNIGDNAFSCTALESIHLPSTVIKINVGSFQGCNLLTEVVLNKGLKEIEAWAFRDCKALQSITIPSTVTKIGKCAFANCKSLVELILNEGLTEIGVSAFQNCTSLNSTVFTIEYVRTSRICLHEIEPQGIMSARSQNL